MANAVVKIEETKTPPATPAATPAAPATPAKTPPAPPAPPAARKPRADKGKPHTKPKEEPAKEEPKKEPPKPPAKKKSGADGAIIALSLALTVVAILFIYRSLNVKEPQAD